MHTVQSHTSCTAHASACASHATTPASRLKAMEKLYMCDNCAVYNQRHALAKANLDEHDCQAPLVVCTQQADSHSASVRRLQIAGGRRTDELIADTSDSCREQPARHGWGSLHTHFAMAMKKSANLWRHFTHRDATAPTRYISCSNRIGRHR